MKLMGHNTRTVSQRYVHPSPESVERAASRMEALNALVFEGTRAATNRRLLRWLRNEKRAVGPEGFIGFGISARMSDCGRPLARTVVLIQDQRSCRQDRQDQLDHRPLQVSMRTSSHFQQEGFIMTENYLNWSDETW